MTTTIGFNLSAEARAKAVRAGLPAQRVQTFTSTDMEVARRALDLGASVDRDGVVGLVARRDFEDPPADVEAALRMIAAQVEADRLRDIAQVAAIQANLVAGAERKAREVLSRPEPTSENPGDPPNMSPADLELLYPELREAYQVRAEAYSAAAAERLRLHEIAVSTYEGGGNVEPPIAPWTPSALDQRVYAEDGRRSKHIGERRRVRLTELVRMYGDANAVERLDTAEGPLGFGLLAEEEALEVVTAALLPVLGDLTEYLPLDEADVREHCECGDCIGEVSFVAVEPSPEEPLTAEEWEAVKEIRRRLLAADLPAGEIRLHEGQCDARECPGWPARRIGVLVTRDLGGGVVITREYGGPIP